MGQGSGFISTLSMLRAMNQNSNLKFDTINREKKDFSEVSKASA
jgi:hypothetical protein